MTKEKIENLLKQLKRAFQSTSTQRYMQHCHKPEQAEKYKNELVHDIFDMEYEQCDDDEEMLNAHNEIVSLLPSLLPNEWHTIACALDNIITSVKKLERRPNKVTFTKSHLKTYVYVNGKKTKWMILSIYFSKKPFFVTKNFGTHKIYDAEPTLKDAKLNLYDYLSRCKKYYRKEKQC